MLVQVDGVFAGDDILDGTTALALLASGGLVALRRLRHRVVRVVGEGSGGRLSLVAGLFLQNSTAIFSVNLHRCGSECGKQAVIRGAWRSKPDAVSTSPVSPVARHRGVVGSLCT